MRPVCRMRAAMIVTASADAAAHGSRPCHRRDRTGRPRPSGAPPLPSRGRTAGDPDRRPAGLARPHPRRPRAETAGLVLRARQSADFRVEVQEREQHRRTSRDARFHGRPDASRRTLCATSMQRVMFPSGVEPADAAVRRASAGRELLTHHDREPVRQVSRRALLDASATPARERRAAAKAEVARPSRRTAPASPTRRRHQHLRRLSPAQYRAEPDTSPFAGPHDAGPPDRPRRPVRQFSACTASR